VGPSVGQSEKRPFCARPSAGEKLRLVQRATGGRAISIVGLATSRTLVEREVREESPHLVSYGPHARL
jgi:hypothetical protein